MYIRAYEKFYNIIYLGTELATQERLVMIIRFIIFSYCKMKYKQLKDFKN